jgi:hypothetical protein
MMMITPAATCGVMSARKLGRLTCAAAAAAGLWWSPS